MKILRRKTIIREKDFEKYLKIQALACGYTSATWHACSLEAIAREITWLSLAGEQFKDGIFLSQKELYQYVDPKNWQPDSLELSARFYIQYTRSKQSLYNPRYTHWMWKYENDGIFIRSRSNQPWLPLGVAVLERQYE